jgi:glycosyltransferase involved in cell wall biosynthesis
MRLALLIPHLGQGGAQAVYRDHYKLLRRDSEVDRIVFTNSGWDEEVEYVLDNHSHINLIGPAARLIYRGHQLAKIVHKRQYDVVISHMDGANWVNVVSGSRARKLLVVHGPVAADENFSRAMQVLRTRLMFPMLYNRAECSVAVSSGIAEEMRRECGVRNVIAIPNYIDVDSIRRRASLEPDAAELPRRFIVTCGRLSEQKKQKVALRLIARLTAAGHSLSLVVLGDGELRDELVDYSRSVLGLKTHCAWEGERDLRSCDVYFLGHVDNPFSIVSRAETFLLTSGWEGFPLALLEAMACGVPVLSSDCSTGPREILSAGRSDVLPHGGTSFEVLDYGIVAPVVHDQAGLDEWVRAAELLLGDEELRRTFSRKALGRVYDFDIQVASQAWREAVDALVSTP